MEEGRTNVNQSISRKKGKKRSRNEQFRDELVEASKKLMVSEVPSKLPCREKEHGFIYSFLKKSISQGGVGAGLYISGMPGTGKTATCRQVVRELKGLSSKKKLRPFRFLEINGMKMPTPHHVYTEFWKLLSGEYSAPKTAQIKLEKYFSEGRGAKEREFIVLLADELDYLLTRRQQIIYNLFEWPTREGAKMVVLGVCNTMDLPERLIPRVSSRLGTQRVIFKAYVREELKKIIASRLESLGDVFGKDSVRFCASSVAGMTGDCRTALQICRRAIDIALKRLDSLKNKNNNFQKEKGRKRRKRNGGKSIKKREGSGKEELRVVTMKDIKAAKTEFFGSNISQTVDTLAQFEKLFLTAMVVFNDTHQVLSGALSEYTQRTNAYIAGSLGLEKLSPTEMDYILESLQEMGMVTVTFNRKESARYIRLTCRTGVIVGALKDDKISSKILSRVSIRDRTD